MTLTTYSTTPAPGDATPWSKTPRSPPSRASPLSPALPRTPRTRIRTRRPCPCTRACASSSPPPRTRRSSTTRRRTARTARVASTSARRLIFWRRLSFCRLFLWVDGTREAIITSRWSSKASVGDGLRETHAGRYSNNKVLEERRSTRGRGRMGTSHAPFSSTARARSRSRALPLYARTPHAPQTAIPSVFGTPPFPARPHALPSVALVATCS